MVMVMKIACVVVVVVCMGMVGAPMVQGQMSCGQLAQTVEPCMGYLQSGGSVSSACCNGVTQIISQATTTAERQQICNCFKTAENSGVNPQYTQSLPKACGYNNFPVFTASTNCSNIN